MKQQLLEQVEVCLVEQLLHDLKTEKMTLGEAKYIAKDFLAALPIENEKVLIDTLYNLKQIYPQMGVVFANFFNKVEEEKTEKKLTLLRSYLQKKDYDGALFAMKEVDING